MAPRGDLTRSAVLALLGTVGLLSRTEIARRLEVSAATITQVTKDLIARGMVVEVEQAPSRGGRPAQLLGLVGSAGRAMGAKVAADRVAIVDVRLDGEVVESWEEPLDAFAVDAPDRLSELLSQAVARAVDAEVPLLGVGVGVPGSVDDQATGIVDAPTLGWQRVPLGERLRAALSVPVLVENDVNTLAVAERLYGRGREHRDFLVVTIGRGVGAGLVVDGTVFRGSSGGAGEFGHMPIEADGPVCSCGNRGCLEAHIGEAALVGKARAAGVIQAAGTYADLLARADRGEPQAKQVYGEAGALLGRAVAGLTNVMDPELLVLLGEGTRAWHHWRPAFEPSLRSHLMPSKRGVPVVVEEWDDSSWARGAAALVLAAPFDVSGMAGGQGALVRARLGREASHRTIKTRK